MSRTDAAAIVFLMIAGTALTLLWPREEPRRAAAPSYSNMVYDPL